MKPELIKKPHEIFTFITDQFISMFDFFNKAFEERGVIIHRERSEEIALNQKRENVLWYITTRYGHNAISFVFNAKAPEELKGLNFFEIVFSLTTDEKCFLGFNWEGSDRAGNGYTQLKEPIEQKSLVNPLVLDHFAKFLRGEVRWSPKGKIEFLNTLKQITLKEH